MFDIGADVLLIPTTRWTSHWELQSMIGKVQGIEGTQLVKRSKSITQIKGSDKQLASLHPFIIDYNVPPWGRDAMSQ